MIIAKNTILPPKGYAAMTIYPFVFVRKGKDITDRIIRHEAIHCEQQKELFVVSIIVSGNFQKNAQDGKLISISGECYRNVDGNFGDSFGYFNGYPSPNSDEMSYDLSQMKRADNNIVWDAIEAIEAEVLPE